MLEPPKCMRMVPWELSWVAGWGVASVSMGALAEESSVAKVSV